MKPVTETHYRARIERVIKALSDEPEVPRSLDELARIAHFSRFHFHRIYRAMVGGGCDRNRATPSFGARRPVPRDD